MLRPCKVCGYYYEPRQLSEIIWDIDFESEMLCLICFDWSYKIANKEMLNASH